MLTGYVFPAGPDVPLVTDVSVIPQVLRSGGTPAIVPPAPPPTLGTFSTPEVLNPNPIPVPPPVVNAPVSTPPMGCSSCGAPAIVPVRPSPIGTIVAPASSSTAPTAPMNASDLLAMLEKAPWWVWLILAVLILRGLLK